MKVTLDTIKGLLNDLVKFKNSSIFSVQVKKKDGETRNMVCRLNVKKYLKGGNRAYDPKEHGLIHVADVAILIANEKLIRNGENPLNPYRSINLEGVKRLVLHKRVYEVNE